MQKYLNADFTNLTPANIYAKCLDLSLMSFHYNMQKTQGSQKILLGYSGGVDSRVLLDLAYKAFTQKLNYKLIAVHINHNLSKNANVWQKHCELTCKMLNIEFKVENVFINPLKIPQNSSLEAELRKERIKIWQQLVGLQDLLLLAHHLNDQLETVLLRLVRGTGIKGLTGIKPATIIKNIKIIRPLLDYNKNQILNYATKNNLNYIEDESNLDLKFSRNFLRHSIVPQLTYRWPNCLSNVNRAIKLLTKVDCFIDQQTQDLMVNCYNYINYHYIDHWIMYKNTLSIKKLLQYEKFIQFEILRKFFINQQLNFPSVKQIQQIYHEIVFAQIDRQPQLKIQNHVICRYRDYIYIYPKNYFNTDLANFNYKIGKSLILYYNPDQKMGLKKVKKIFQEFAIPPWLRSKYPLVFLQGKLIAIVGLWVKELRK